MIFRSKWLDWKSADTTSQRSYKRHKSPSVAFVAPLDMVSAENPSPIVCIFCRQPVKRGTPGTGALAGQDLHMACYEKANGKIDPAESATHRLARARAGQRLPQLCIRCGQPLNYTDKGITWLIDNGEAVHKGACPRDDDVASADAEEPSAIQTKANS